MFGFALGGPTAPSRVERRTEGSAAQGSSSAFEVGLELGLIGGLVAEFLTEVSLMGTVPTEEKASSAGVQSHSEVEGQLFVMLFGQVVLPSSVSGTVEWFYE